MYKKSIFWFRQDLRVQDNTGLFEAVHGSKEVLPLFIFDENIISKFGGLSDQKFGFLREALEKITTDLQKIGGEKVIVLQGKPEDIIPDLVQKYDIECVYTNTSYGTYGKKRDTTVSEKIHHMGCDFESHKDFLLVEPHEVEQRKVFTPFYKLWQKVEFDFHELELTEFSQLKSEEQTEARDFVKIEKHPYFTMDFGLDRFENHIKKSYKENRNDLWKDGVSRLSPYHRHGIFSIRQIYNKAKNTSDHFVSELAWREFWHHIFYNFPKTKDQEFLEKYRYLKWDNDAEKFQKWCDGETGYPIVDAAMKQLNETNWMHGRARMVVASFLTKDMHIDWRLGEKYFKEKLLDYDEAVNLGNWQWSASVGADPKPLRIFNPILQSQKFDPHGKYIFHFIPKLENQAIKAVHDPLEETLEYTKPIVDHREETRNARDIYKASYAEYEKQKSDS
ncbi:DNA photolyase family protein [Candidatus Gracilibacteria bacterium]|nr:DNA photolyase family protein [Candidatus Gracilibacteria bacterium]